MVVIKDKSHRKDIDGLRAIAVLAVVLYHAGLTGLSGGFVGVDMFFVISGFLITKNILSSLESDSFSFTVFYVRRIKRIFPLLFFITVVVYLIGYVYFDPESFRQLSASVFSVLSISSNIYFYLTTGYFSLATELKPLVHTWSLSVEEQFYFFVPLILFVFHKYFRRYIPSVIIFLAVISFVASVYSAVNYPDFSYYLIISRGWEILIGAFFSLYINIPKRFSTLFNIIGLIAVFGSIFFIDATMPFPGYTAIPAVLGTALLLATPDSYLSRKFLSNKSLGWFGLISYSLYLWHQPVYALSKKIFDFGYGPYESTLLFFISIGLSVFSYRYIENFFRYNVSLAVKYWYSLFFLLIIIMLVLSYSAYSKGGMPNRFKLTYAPLHQLISPHRNRCHTDGINYMKPDDACVFSNNEGVLDVNKTYVFGDSHAVELAYSLSGLNSISVRQLTFSSCSFYLKSLTNPGCNDWLADVNDLLKAEKPDTLVISFRYDLYLDETELLYERLAEFLGQPSLVDVNVILIGAVPVLHKSALQLIYPGNIFSDKIDNYVFNTNTPTHINTRLKKIAESLDSKIKVYDGFMDNIHKSNSLLIDGQPMYFDDNHLSIFSTNNIAKNLFNNGAL
jgi:peptidoglycan/LPS O-acetylase OafA/YrhL